MKLSPIENRLWNTYLSWKKGYCNVCNRLGYESTMQLIPQYDLICKDKVLKIDFVEPTTKIAIELDGFNWHFLNKDQVERDKKRERLIILEDYTLLRYTGSEVHKDPIEVLEEIYFTYCLKAINLGGADGKK